MGELLSVSRILASLSLWLEQSFRIDLAVMASYRFQFGLP